MNWKIKLHELERAEEWNTAITFMEKIITNNLDDMDAYICMNYLLMNFYVEEGDNYEKLNDPEVRTLIKKYFDESYAKFSDNLEYLYLTARTACIAEFLLGIHVEEYEAMLEKARELEPDNLVYQETYYWNIRRKNPKEPSLIAYAHLVLRENSPIEQQLKTKGALGKYLLELKQGWAELFYEGRFMPLKLMNK